MLTFMLAMTLVYGRHTLSTTTCVAKTVTIISSCNLFCSAVSSLGMVIIAGDFFLEKLAIIIAHIVRIMVAQRGIPSILPDSCSKNRFTPS